MFDYRSRYRPLPGKFAAFMYTIARHVWIDWRRGAQRRRRLASQLAAECAPADRPSAESVPTDAQLDVRRALNELSDKLREVIVLNVFQGLDYSQVAEILGIPVGTVKSRAFLAFQQMRRILSHDEEV
jgi:RNA polymerase sigma-70 factor (ECF subfamily)